MTKLEFFKDLQEIITDKIYIGISIEEIDKEINNNLWSISANQELINNINLEDFSVFFDEVIKNREWQVSNSKSRHGMIFYIWFEHQSGRLRFNLISDFHKKLPFGCKVIEVDKLQDIVIELLQYKYHDGIPVLEYEEDSVQPNINSEVPKLKVFKLHISKSNLS